MKLYEIAAEYQALLEAIDPETGEITPEIEQALDDLQDSVDLKVESICKILADRKADEAALEAEEKRLAAKRRALANGSDGLKQYLMHHLDALGLPKVKTQLFNVAIQKASRPSIRWSGNPDNIPVAYRKVTTSLDGNAAYEAWKRDELTDHEFDICQTRYLMIR
jgi:hypothetical protein